MISLDQENLSKLYNIRNSSPEKYDYTLNSENLGAVDKTIDRRSINTEIKKLIESDGIKIRLTEKIEDDKKSFIFLPEKSGQKDTEEVTHYVTMYSDPIKYDIKCFHINLLQSYAAAFLISENSNKKFGLEIQSLMAQSDAFFRKKDFTLKELINEKEITNLYKILKNTDAGLLTNEINAKLNNKDTFSTVNFSHEEIAKITTVLQQKGENSLAAKLNGNERFKDFNNQLVDIISQNLYGNTSKQNRKKSLTDLAVARDINYQLQQHDKTNGSRSLGIIRYKKDVNNKFASFDIHEYPDYVTQYDEVSELENLEDLSPQAISEKIQDKHSWVRTFAKDIGNNQMLLNSSAPSTKRLIYNNVGNHWEQSFIYFEIPENQEEAPVFYVQKSSRSSHGNNNNFHDKKEDNINFVTENLAEKIFNVENLTALAEKQISLWQPLAGDKQEQAKEITIPLVHQTFTSGTAIFNNFIGKKILGFIKNNAEGRKQQLSAIKSDQQFAKTKLSKIQDTVREKTNTQVKFEQKSVNNPVNGSRNTLAHHLANDYQGVEELINIAIDRINLVSPNAEILKSEENKFTQKDKELIIKVLNKRSFYFINPFINVHRERINTICENLNNLIKEKDNGHDKQVLRNLINTIQSAVALKELYYVSVLTKFEQFLDTIPVVGSALNTLFKAIRLPIYLTTKFLFNKIKSSVLFWKTNSAFANSQESWRAANILILSSALGTNHHHCKSAIDRDGHICTLAQHLLSTSLDKGYIPSLIAGNRVWASKRNFGITNDAEREVGKDNENGIAHNFTTKLSDGTGARKLAEILIPYCQNTKIQNTFAKLRNVCSWKKKSKSSSHKKPPLNNNSTPITPILADKDHSTSTYGTDNSSRNNQQQTTNIKTSKIWKFRKLINISV